MRTGCGGGGTKWEPVRGWKSLGALKLTRDTLNEDLRRQRPS